MDEYDNAVMSLAETIISIAINNPAINNMLLHELTYKLNEQGNPLDQDCIKQLVAVLSNKGRIH